MPEIPTAPGRLPVLGHAHLVTGDPRTFLLKLPADEPIVRVYLGPKPSYLLTTPELIRDVSLGRAGSFHREALREAISDLVSGATNVLSGDEHDLRRRMIAPVFRQGRLTEYAQTVATIADEWSASLCPGPCGELRIRVHDLVTRTMFATLFQSDTGGGEIGFIRERVPWLLSEVIIRGALPAPLRRLRFRADRRFAGQSREVRAAMKTLIRQRRDHPDRGDMLSALLHHVDAETGATLSDDETADELLLALAAGIGSQSSIFSWLIYEVARAPEIAERVYAESDSATGTQRPFLRNVLTETLRVWAPWISLVTSDGPGRIGPVDFPDGTNILFSPYLIHHRDTYFPDAAVFDPDRWDGDGGDRQAMMPFGVGQRHCPGSQFALLSLTVQAVALFSRWRVTLPADFEVKAQGKDFVLSPAALPVTLVPR
ncbi:cytochrome P450 [Mycolicibacterium fluoranthenivorans]|uniref:Cytochrome P450 n=1 Tax=Mycolicibacterium fluoranthenivorans TaxID=258505 RepID=A0A7G8PJ03_9MYCO|nr:MULTISPECIES: cytochrome P450 [Mycobacteriaceae]MCV7252605.1 cytochrome P450 [Mycobacterium hackensackense]QNJ94319.1 cytochrome P450 [Mycolicibacterium fluoranthenivorans]